MHEGEQQIRAICLQIKHLHMTLVNISVTGCTCDFMCNIFFLQNIAHKIQSLHAICGMACNEKGG
jgi:hypothetical protein